MDEPLARIGLHVDDFNKLRILDSDVAVKTEELKDECADFNSKVQEFQRITQSLLEMLDSVSKEVEKEKMKAIGTQNLLKSVEKQRRTQQQQMESLIIEKKKLSERLRIQLESLQKEEAEQSELIEQLLTQQ